MSTIPHTMKASIIEKDGVAAVKEIPVPSISPTEVLVKVEYAAANPTDYKHLDGQGGERAIMGLDFFGTVVQTGAEVTALHVGDRVAAAVHGNKFQDKGSFAQYLKVGSDMCWKVPDTVSGAEASTFGVAYITAAMCLFQHQKNAWPPAKRDSHDWFLVQGGSGSVGLFAVQLAKIAGYKVAATCSPHSYDLVKSFGADAVFDYHDPDEAAKQIREVSGGGVVGALETIGGVQNGKLAVNSFAKKGGIVTSLIVVPEELKKIRPEVEVGGRIIMYTIYGYSFEFLRGQPPLPHKPEDHEWYLQLVEHTPELITHYGVKGNPVDVRNGLESIEAGLDDLRKGKVSGKKIVFKID